MQQNEKKGLQELKRSVSHVLECSISVVCAPAVVLVNGD